MEKVGQYSSNPWAETIPQRPLASRDFSTSSINAIESGRLFLVFARS